MIRSYGSTLLRPGAGSSGEEPSGGPHVTSEIARASRLLSASVRRPEIIIRPRRRQSSVMAMNGTPRTFPGCFGGSPAPAVGETPPERLFPALPGDAPPAAPPPPPDGVTAPDEGDPFPGLRRFRNPNGTRSVLLGLAGVVTDRLDDGR